MSLIRFQVRDSDGSTIDLSEQDAEEAETSARAKRVILVNSSGTIIKATQQEENRLGSECSGSSGATGRVLTLQNSSESGAPIAVWVEQSLRNPANYTLTHNSSSSTLTFDSIEILDADRIKVTYYV